jgi:hypothetical protein
MATLDDALAEASKLLEQLSKQQLLGKVDASIARQPDDQRDNRIHQLMSRIAGLKESMANVVALWEGAIAGEQLELDTLKAQATPVAPPPAAGNATAPPASPARPRQAGARAKTKRNKEP